MNIVIGIINTKYVPIYNLCNPCKLIFYIQYDHVDTFELLL